MKTSILKAIVCILIAVFSWSCSDLDKNTVQSTGLITIHLDLDTSVLTKSEGVTEEITLRIQPTDSEWIPITNQPSSIYSVTSGTHSYELNAGYYILTASIGTNANGKPSTEPYYVGSSQVVMLSGKEIEASIECKLTTVIVKVNYDNIVNIYSNYDYETIISTPKGESITFSKEDNNLTGYFLPDDLTVKFRYGNDGNWLEKTMENISALQPQYEYVIIYKVKEEEGGDSSGSGGIGITVNDDPDNQQGNIIIELPKVTHSLFDVKDEDIGEVYAKVYAEASLNTGHEVTELILEYKEFNQEEWIAINTSLGADKKFLAQLTELQPKRVYQVRVKDDELTTKEFETKAIEYDFHSWATFTMASAVSEQTNLVDIKFEYRKINTENWFSINSGNSYNATLNSLEPGTTYECRLVANNMLGNIDVFETEPATQLPNSSFENWQSSKAPYLIYGADEEMFWDSGNHGAATLGGNTTTYDKTYSSKGEGGSAKLYSQFIGAIGFGKFAAGNLFAGEYIDTDGTSGAIINFGRPFTSRPSKFTGWFRYEPQKINYTDKSLTSELIAEGAVSGNIDKGHIYIVLGDWEKPVQINSSKRPEGLFNYKTDPHVIAYGEKILTEKTAVSGMELFDIPLNYVSLTRKPTHVIIVCTGSKYGDYFTGAGYVTFLTGGKNGAGSSLWLDDFELVYEDDPIIIDKFE